MSFDLKTARPARHLPHLAAAFILACLLAVPHGGARANPEAALKIVGDVLEAVGESLMGYDRYYYDDDETPEFSMSSEEEKELVKQGVRDKALFVAELEPELAAAGIPGSHLLPPWERMSFRAAEQLWMLQATPEMFEREKAALLDDRESMDRRLDRLHTTVNDLYSLAALTWISVKQEEEGRGYDIRFDRYSLGGKLAIMRELQPYLEFVAANFDLLRELTEDWYIDEDEALPLLWTVRHSKEAMEFAVTMLEEDDIPHQRRMAIARELAENPANAEDMLERAQQASRVSQLFYAMSLWEYELESIGLPLASILPEDAERIAANGSVPLAADGAAPPSPELAVRDMRVLLDEETQDELWEYDYYDRYPPPELPLTREGETLYVFVDGHEDEGLPVYGGILAPFAEYGPWILPYNKHTASDFSYYLAGRRDVPVFAAVGGPEEVAAHLNSLVVMLAERERSLYGSFDEYNKKPDARFLENVAGSRLRAAFTPADYPDDAPGKLPRMVNLSDTALFAALLPRADAKGLARLMGPIRAVWVPSAASIADGGYEEDTPDQTMPFWTEFRYTPAAPAQAGGKAAEQAGERFSLEGSPLLELAAGDLEALRVLHMNAVYGHLNRNLGYDICYDAEPELEGAECREAMAEAGGLVAATFWTLDRMGIKAPLNQHVIAYAMFEFRNQPENLAKLYAILRDAGKTGAEKADAAEALLRDSWHSYDDDSDYYDDGDDDDEDYDDYYEPDEDEDDYPERQR